MAERKMRREADLPEIYLYEKDTTSVTYTDFVNKELILFSNTDNERSIPSMVDGMLVSLKSAIFIFTDALKLELKSDFLIYYYMG